MLADLFNADPEPEAKKPANFKRMPCHDCKKDLSECKCWERCKCEWLKRVDKPCKNPVHNELQ